MRISSEVPAGMVIVCAFGVTCRVGALARESPVGFIGGLSDGLHCAVAGRASTAARNDTISTSKNLAFSFIVVSRRFLSLIEFRQREALRIAAAGPGAFNT